MIFDIYQKKYLERLGVEGDIRTDPEMLRLLHRRHMYNIPFENLDIHSHRKIILEKARLVDKIVSEGRGGFCYELNGAFYELLSTIGFRVKRISAGVYDGKTPGPDFDHMALIVNINGNDYLADVGFGDSFIEPLAFISNEIQDDEAGLFKITESDEKDYFILSRLSEGKDFVPQYRFSLLPRELDEFKTMCEYHQTSPASHFTQKLICSKAAEGGRISLSNLRLIMTRNRNKEQTDITRNEFYILLKKHFNIILQDEIIFPVNQSSAV